MVSQQFRRDVFVKGGRPMNSLEQLERYRGLGFVLSSHPDDISMKLQATVGEITLQEAVYKPLIEALAEHNFAPNTVAELAVHPSNKGRPLPQLIEALIILTGAGHVQRVQDAEGVKLAKPRCKALNTHLFNRARFSGDVAFLASPVMGGGVAAGRFQQLFLLARQLHAHHDLDRAQIKLDVPAPDIQQVEFAHLSDSSPCATCFCQTT